jgi:hypothetical protein
MRLFFARAAKCNLTISTSSGILFSRLALCSTDAWQTEAESTAQDQSLPAESSARVGI